MSTVIFKGEEAIHYAEAHGRKPNRYAGEGEPAREGLTIEEAHQIADVHPELVWIETHVSVNPGEPYQDED